MLPAHHPAEFLTVAIIVIAVLLVCTVMGRYFLRRLAIVLAVAAVIAVVAFDGASPL